MTIYITSGVAPDGIPQIISNLWLCTMPFLSRILLVIRYVRPDDDSPRIKKGFHGEALALDLSF